MNYFEVISTAAMTAIILYFSALCVIILTNAIITVLEETIKTIMEFGKDE